MNWKVIKFKDFLHRSKLPVDIVDKESYKRVTIRIKHQGVSLRDTEIGKKIGTKKQFVLKGGQFIMSKIDARQGAFGIAPDEVEGAIITGNFWAYDVNQDLVSIEWLNQYTNSAAFYDVCERASSGITHRKYLDEQAFLNHEIEIPDIKEQLVLVEQIGAKKLVCAEVFSEVDHQLVHLTQLRQALLREAMQGQLLSQDPTDEPAAVLLQQLQAAAKPGKKGRGKAGVLFVEEAESVEGPYALPKEWTWCKLGDLVERSDSGWSPACANYPAAEGVWGVLRTTSVQKLQFLADENKQLPASLTPRPQYEVKPGDILVTRAGPKNRVGVCCVVDDVRPKLMISDKLIRLHLHEKYAYSKFIALALNIGVSAQFLEDVKTGMADSQVNISQDNLRATIIPLPPLAEQHRIVAKLEQLLGHCDALEQRIRESRRLAEQLLATALREALAPPAGIASPEMAELELAEAIETPSPRAPRRGAQLALGSLLD